MSKIDILNPNLYNFKLDFEQFIHDKIIPQKKVEQSHDTIKKRRNANDIKFGSCNREVCVFSHSQSVNSNKFRKECRSYERGFCKYGPTCKYKHTRRVLCDLYLTGFCTRGPTCPNAHPRHFINSLKSSSRVYRNTRKTLVMGLPN
ncbi:cleavage and polyadenylation specificity factor subunit 4 [Rhizophagus clarus]|uniref:mRNA 3'-end-processing protein n=1 Tax=Rhizophagus clarus TaxID=94130 RepID=A0A8H3QSK4_9GLOM|nr:cleavage and polyadenylation specificity factor subunit 4 [Rhizophagus clarus]